MVSHIGIEALVLRRHVRREAVVTSVGASGAMNSRGSAC